MEIINSSVRIIDYEAQEILLRDIPDSFESFVRELISHIHTNASVREYKTRSVATEVIGSILQIIERKEDADFVLNRVNGIATRLLSKEIEAQKRVARMNTNVQKGSLVQALLFDEEDNSYLYLLAKVEHTDFVDDYDFSFKTGFSKDKKTIWKSCIIEIADVDSSVFYAKIYTNTVANYWGNDFLELDQVHSDEVNTSNAFRAIDGTLNRNMRGQFQRDHTIIRNAFISYFKNNEHIDFPTMVESILGNYDPVDLPVEKLNSIKEKMLTLPQTKNFDSQFNTVKSAINARIKRVYPVNDGIELKITDGIEDLANTIKAFRDDDGTRYIQIKTNNEETFQKFKTQ
ncbi:hypothetical protein ACL02P_23910 [Paenibacillus sp. MB22_1]|uniref:hypothetical protein n=1 Tax=Paenibacillus sp. MB22_1 TaxID=3383121 RepID=UPI0039A1721C